MAARIFNAVKDVSNNIQRVYVERANDNIKWNLFTFNGCVLQSSQYRNPLY